MSTHDSQLVLRLPRAALDEENFALGLVRLTKNERFAYINRAAREIVGQDVAVGDPLHLMPLVEDSHRALQAGVAARFVSGSMATARYTLEVARDGDEPGRLVCVTTVPELDADGRTLGSVGIVVDGAMEQAELELHRQLQNASDARSLYDALHGQLSRLLQFDTMLVVAIGHARNHMRLLHECPPPTTRQPERTRWTPIEPFLEPLIEHFQAGELDLFEFTTTPDFMRWRARSPNAEHFARRGFRHSLRLGVHKSGELVATVSLLRRDDIAFTAAELARCSQLPYEATVNAAIAMDEASEARAASALIDRLARADGNSTAIATLLVKQLAAHFNLEHVALLRVEQARGKVRLVVQAGPSALPQDFEQDIAIGLLGRCVRDGELVNEGDVACAMDYLVGMSMTRSELVIPLFGRCGASCAEERPTVNWLLNIESSQLHAFADEDQANVMRVLAVAAVALDRAATLEVKAALANSVADAILQTDDHGAITYANPAAERLFGRPFDPNATACCRRRETGLSPELPALRYAAVDTCLDWPDQEVFEDDDGESRGATRPMGSFVDVLFQRTNGFSSQPAKALRVDGTETCVLVSAAALEGEQGGRIIVATDVSQRELLTRQNAIQRELRRIGSEIRSPLVLAHSFLSDMLATADPSANAVSKAAEQLRKAMLPLEGLMRAESASEHGFLPREPVDLADLLQVVSRQLPPTMADDLGIDLRGGHRLVARAARNELQFCIEATLAHLLRQKALAERIEVSCGCTAHNVYVLVTTRGRKPEEGADLPASQAMAADDDFLARPVVEGLMRRMRGRLVPSASRLGYWLLLEPKE